MHKLRPWQQYQEQVAEVFRAASCDATPDALIEGMRAKHKVDVQVIFKRHGIRCLWIVECKYWNSKVTKEKVMALKSIVDDCGADRGLIVSRMGFQSGAIRASTKTNITLTSIDELQEYIDDKDREIEELHSRLATVESQLDEYRCPHCGSELIAREYIEYDERNSGTVETFECGFQTGGFVDHPCPFSQDFPTLEDFDFTIFQDGEDYLCQARPKTKKARGVSLSVGRGRTAEEAREQVVERYRYLITPPRQEFRGKWIQRSGYRG